MQIKMLIQDFTNIQCAISDPDNTDETTYPGKCMNESVIERKISEYLGMFVYVHAGVGGDVLGADDFTVSLESLKLEEFG